MEHFPPTSTMDQPLSPPSPYARGHEVPAPRARPTLVGVLAVLHMIGGAATLVLGVGFGRVLGEAGSYVGASPLLTQLYILFLGALGLASGVGMWRGTAWGWWLAGFYYLLAVYRNANAMVLISGMPDQLAGVDRGPGYFYGKHAARIVTHSLALYYLFRENVLAYFGLGRIEKGRALGRLAKPLAVLVLLQLLATAL